MTDNADMNGGDDVSAAPSEEKAKATGGHAKEAALFIRILSIIGVLLLGVLVFVLLMGLRKKPAHVDVTAETLSVRVVNVSPEDVPVTVSGLGEVRALNVVPIAPEVPGAIVDIHPRLEMGEVVAEGELLFAIDSRDYEAAKAQAEAQIAQLTKTVERLTRQYEIDRGRLKTLDRNQVLMKQEFERTRDLYEKDEVGTRSAVDHAEMALNQAADSRDQLSQQVTLYPVQIQEAKSALDGARAQLQLAEANLERTDVRAPFDARIKQVHLEKGQYVSPGMQVLTLADDTVLEISVSLDSRDAKDWLLFDEGVDDTPGAWFAGLKPVPCRVAWTEDPENHAWEGEVHRVEMFDQRNRTLSLAIRVSGEAARVSSGGLPLVEGMFCKVEIPGKVMAGVYRLPRRAVTYEGNVYVVRDGHLAVQAVEVIRGEGQETFVRGALAPGEQVITTRLLNPLPNTAVRVEEVTEAAS